MRWETVCPPPVSYVPAPYCPSCNQEKTQNRPAPIFITARFRSGSSFLWQIFRAIETVSAYYEPLNENCWFQGKGYKTDPSHIGITNYHAEYEGLGRLGRIYNRDWICRNLHMTGWDYDPGLYTYIDELIRATDKRAVLQFNRVDFRLPWLRTHFPGSRIVHLYRHPREQWISIQRDGGPVSKTYRYRTGDHLGLFYLIGWANDLKRVFPFLEPSGQHPYAIHYYLWYLSYLYGKQYADVSIRYETLVKQFNRVVPDLMGSLGIELDSGMKEGLSRLNSGEKACAWPEYAESDWFEKIETAAI